MQLMSQTQQTSHHALLFLTGEYKYIIPVPLLVWTESFTTIAATVSRDVAVVRNITTNAGNWDQTPRLPAS